MYVRNKSPPNTTTKTTTKKEFQGNRTLALFPRTADPGKKTVTRCTEGSGTISSIESLSQTRRLQRKTITQERTEGRAQRWGLLPQ